MHAYIHTHIHTYTHTHSHTHTYTRTHIHTYTDTHTHTYIYICVCKHILICIYIYMYVCMYIYIYTHFLYFIYVYMQRRLHPFGGAQEERDCPELEWLKTVCSPVRLPCIKVSSVQSSVLGSRLPWYPLISLDIFIQSYRWSLIVIP